MAGRLSVLAGAGDLVPHAVQAALQCGYQVQVLALSPRQDVVGAKVVDVELSNPLAILWSLKTFRTTHIVMAGGVHISDRQREGLIRFAGGNASVASTGDASLAGLSGALKRITGATLLGVHEIAPDLLATEGHLAGPAPGAAEMTSARYALKLARDIGALDIGQAVVVAGERPISIEDIGGTDELIARVADFRARGIAGDGDSALVLAKAVKPQQPFFADLPAIGPHTVINARAAGIKIIAVEASRSLIIERSKLVALADEAGVSILGLTVSDA